MQDSSELDNDIFFDKESFEQFCSEYEDVDTYTNEKLQKDLDLCIKKNIIDDISWGSDHDELLKEILPNINIEFIKKCFDIDILNVINNDNKHEYSNNFKKVIKIMFETSKNLLIDKVNKYLNFEFDFESKSSKKISKKILV